MSGCDEGNGTRSAPATVSAFCVVVWIIAALVAGRPSDASAEPPRITSVRVGFADRYKVGLWTPVDVAIRGGSERLAARLSLVVPDGDGVPSRVATASDQPCDIPPEGKTSVRLLCRLGRVCGTMTAQLRRRQSRRQTAFRNLLDGRRRPFPAGPRAAQAHPHHRVERVGRDRCGQIG